MFINSQYDQWAISNILKIRCLQKGASGYTPKNCTTPEMNAIEDYRNRYMQFINTKLSGKGWGMWTVACSQHVYQIYPDMYDSDLERVPMRTGMTVKDAMEQFILNDKVEWIADADSWPSNEACAY